MRPRKLNEVETLAATVGLTVSTYSPGDGTRYRFVKAGAESADYFGAHTSDIVSTEIGRGDALKFLAAFKSGRTNGIREAMAEIARGYNADMSAEQLAIVVEQLLSRGPWLYDGRKGDAEGFRDLGTVDTRSPFKFDGTPEDREAYVNGGPPGYTSEGAKAIRAVTYCAHVRGAEGITDKIAPPRPQDRPGWIAPESGESAADTLLGILRSVRRREPLADYLGCLALSPGTVINPEKRQAYARKWVARILRSHRYGDARGLCGYAGLCRRCTV